MATTDLELLQQTKSALLAVIAANPGKVSYSIDGQSVSHGELYDRLAKLDAAIRDEAGPSAVITEGYV